MKKLSNPNDLLVAVLSELLWVERRLAFDVLPSVIESVSDSGLRALLEQHLAETREHVNRVEQAFKSLGFEPSSAFSPGASALFDHHDEVAGKIVEPALADQWHASAAVATEHLELALYAAIDALAPDAVKKALAPNVKDEASALERLETRLQGKS